MLLTFIIRPGRDLKHKGKGKQAPGYGKCTRNIPSFIEISETRLVTRLSFYYTNALW